ncbi:nose resistant to fluoxetine protein 6 [Trichonephila inaurata madagascariensis]|uniref:Nose resistant to fluoxetine protein 6 n=1 Tax=Trichonephila inaurata madagascariensis TaxID=2747483 RepID=A0A8X7CAM2_9ARAC|nr:nose resistant to fluoxetine protein 6 [Trichonephila inaurata madagascariensis]
MFLKNSKLIILFLISIFCVGGVFSQIIGNPNAHQSYDFEKLVQNSVQHLSVSKDLKSLNGASLKEINNFLRNYINVILRDILSQTDSSKCVRDFDYVFDNLQSGMWAIKMFDSYGKPESGVLNGNVKWLGEYFECLEIRAPPKPYEDVGGFQGKYCTLQITLNLGNVSLPLNTAVCLPDSCDPSDPTLDLSQNISDHLPYNEDLDSLFSSKAITCQSTSPRKLTNGAIVVICLISIFAALSVIGSLITVCEYYLKINAEKEAICGAYDKISVNSDLDKLSSRGSNVLPDWLEKCKPFFNCFCMFTNGEKILNTTSTEGQLPCLHGIRFLSMSWVILCHGYMFGVGSIRNTADIVNLFDTWTFQVILNGFYSVDAFFVLSGFLVAYLFFQQAAKTDGKIPWLYFYIHRFVRLTPVYMMVMAFYTTLMSHLGSGPLWNFKDTDANCHASWWWNILYINNFQTSGAQCMGWGWYLANDMQFYVISPLFLVTLFRWPKIGYSLIALFLSITFITNFVLTYEYNLLTGLANAIVQSDTSDVSEFMARWNDFFTKLYYKPYTRMSPYLVGIILAYYLFRRKQNNAGKLNLITLTIGWIAASSMTLACLFGLYHHKQTIIEASFYNALNRTCFAFGLAWVMFVCIIGQGDVVNRILSWKVWIPLSRLTFCAYLVHPIVQFAYYYSIKRLFVFSHATVVMLHIGFLMISYSAALMTSLLFESPVIRLERLIRNKFMSKNAS